jgi:hypothetical protein
VEQAEPVDLVLVQLLFLVGQVVLELLGQVTAEQVAVAQQALAELVVVVPRMQLVEAEADPGQL